MNKPKTMSIDLETFSDVDIGKCGVYKYTESPAFEILLFAYSLDFGPVQLVDLAQGEQVPSEILDLVWDPAVEKTAFNANFERTALASYYGRYCPPEQWSCTMVLAASCGLPMSLKGVGVALNLSEDQAKMKEGADLIRYFCIPCRPTKTNGQRTRNLPEHAPEKWEIFRRYNIRDVETENTIRLKLLKWRPERSEQRLWELDQRMNDKGVRIEPKLAENAITIGNAYREELLQKAQEISGLENPNSTEQIKSWLEEQEGIEVLSLNKKAIADVYASLSDEATKEVLKLREEFSKSSNKKYEAFLRCRCEDDHVRGTFQFYGASTGRWAGRLVQLQNLSHDTIPDLDTARDLVLLGDAEDFEIMYPKVQQTLSCLIRTTIIPEPDSRLIVADFSAIEARVIAWIAGEQWRLDAFKNNEDIYCASASRAFKKPVVKHGINGELRAKGKIIELACIAEDQLVLTDHGLVPIQDVTTSMKVWDGESWVEHDGVVYRGEKYVIDYAGLSATDDHLVYVEGQAEPVYFGNAAAYGLHIIQTGDGRREIRLGGDNKSGEEMECNKKPLLCPYEMYGLWFCPMAAEGESHFGEIQRLPELFGSTEENTSVVGSETDSGKAEMRESKGCWIQELWSKRNKVRLSECDYCRCVDDRELRTSWSEHGDRSDRHERRLCPWKFEMGNSQGELCESKALCTIKVGSVVLALCENSSYSEAVPGLYEGADNCTGLGCGSRKAKELARYRGPVKVYDIRNAGRHHRYTVSGKLVHNCGYGGSVGAMKNFGADKLGMTEEEMVDLVDKWREASPHIVALWKALETAAIRCVTSKKPTLSSTGSIRFDLEDGVLWTTLPSGRRIAYWGAEMGKDRWGRPSLTYMTQNQTTKKWVRTETFGGKLVENCVAGGARIITDSGIKPLSCLRIEDKVWDGVEFVSHAGLSFKGMQDCVCISNVFLTPDHRVLTTGGWKSAKDCDGLVGIQVRLPDSYLAKRRKYRRWKNKVACAMRLWADVLDGHKRYSKGGKKRPSDFVWMYEEGVHSGSSVDAWDVKAPSVCSMAQHEAKVYGTNAQSLEELWRAGHSCMRQMAKQFREFLGGHGAKLRERFGHRQDRQQRGLYAGELSVGRPENELSEPKTNTPSFRRNNGKGFCETAWNKLHDIAVSFGSRRSGRLTLGSCQLSQPVYDILDCGPRHRFVVLSEHGPLIVHNCVQATARDVLKEALFHLNNHGYDVRATIHDEVIITDPYNHGSLEEVIRLMCKGAAWTEGLPLNADGYYCSSYRKE